MLDVSTVDWFKEPEDIEYPQRYSVTDKKRDAQQCSKEVCNVEVAFHYRF